MSTIIARTWKQPKCLWTDKWVKKMGYIHTTEHYTAIKSEEIGSFVEIWMDGESVIQSKSEREKQILYINAHVGISFWLRKGDFQWVCVDRQDRRTNTEYRRCSYGNHCADMPPDPWCLVLLTSRWASLLPSPKVWKEPGFSTSCTLCAVSSWGFPRKRWMQRMMFYRNIVLSHNLTLGRERGSKFLVFLLIKALIPLQRLHLHDSITTQRPHLQIPSHWHTGD